MWCMIHFNQVVGGQRSAQETAVEMVRASELHAMWQSSEQGTGRRGWTDLWVELVDSPDRLLDAARLDRFPDRHALLSSQIEAGENQ